MSPLACPGSADELVGCEALQGLEPSGEVVGLDEVAEVLSELVVALVMIALDGRVLDGSVHSLDLTIIRHDGCGALVVQLFSLEDGVMVSPSGTRGTGSTKVRAGRRQTLG
jgi:hypothetical protein